MTQYPVIGITIGDPHGIGPEVSLKALEKLGQQLEYKPILIGNLQVLRNTATRLQISLRARQQLIGSYEQDIWRKTMQFRQLSPLP